MNEQQMRQDLDYLKAKLKYVTARPELASQQKQILANIANLEQQLSQISAEKSAYPNAQFLKPDPKTGMVNYFGTTEPTPTPTPKTTGKGGTGKGKTTPKAPAPVAAAPTRPSNANLMASLPTSDSLDASAGAYSNPNAFANKTPQQLNTGIKPAIPNADPTKANVTPTTGQQAAGVTNPAMGWQSYIGMGTDLLSGAMAMSMANKPLTPFRQPQAYDMMMQEVTQRRNEGLPADQQALAEQRTQNQYRTDVANIARVSNGSAGLYMSGLQGASANAQAANLATLALGQQVRQQNQGVFNNAAVQDMNREQAMFAQNRQEELNSRNAYAQAAAANFQQAGARMDYIQQYEDPNSFYSLLRENVKGQINGWGNFLRQPISV